MLPNLEATIGATRSEVKGLGAKFEARDGRLIGSPVFDKRQGIGKAERIIFDKFCLGKSFIDGGAVSKRILLFGKKNDSSFSRN